MRDHLSISIESLLAHVPLFNGLGPEEMLRVARGSHEINAQKGEIIFHRGAACTGFYILVYGQVKLSFTSAQGNEKIVEVLQQGQSFGKEVMFLDKPHLLSAQTLADSLVLHVSKASIFEEMARNHDFARKMMARMAMRLHQLMTDVESYSLHSGKQRIIAYLIGELDENQLDATDVVIELSINKGIIASRLNLTQEHFSRILHELTGLGLIAVEGKKIRIPSVPKLNKHQI